MVAFIASVDAVVAVLRPSAEAAAEKIARSDDPGRLGRSAYHLIHPVMVAGIIVTAAADELSWPSRTPPAATTAWMVLGGPRCSWLGHAAFKYVVWRYVSWPRLAGIAVLALLASRPSPFLSLALAACAAALIAVVAISDRLPWPPRPS